MVIIVYCDQCGLRIPEGDLNSGAATRVDEYHALCGACSPARTSGRSRKPASDAPPSSTDVKDGIRASSTRVVPVRSSSKPELQATGTSAAGVAKAATTRHGEPARESRHPAASARTVAASSANNLLIVGGIAVVVSVVILAVYLGVGRSEPQRAGRASASDAGRRPDVPPEVPVAKPVAAHPPPLVKPDVPPDAVKTGVESMADIRNQIAARQLEEAKALKSNPDEAAVYYQKLQNLAQGYRSTPAGEEAVRLLKDFKLPGQDEPLAGEADWVLAVDLVALVDPSRDSVRGKWRKEGVRLIVEREACARIEIPYAPPEEYDFRATFVRSDGNEDVNLILTHAGRSFFWSMAGEKNTAFGFDQVDARNAFQNRTAVRVDSAIENGREYHVVVQVRRSSLKAWVDGKCICFHATNYKDMGMRRDWALRANLLGLGVHNGNVTFSLVQIREVTGKGKPSR